MTISNPHHERKPNSIEDSVTKTPLKERIYKVEIVNLDTEEASKTMYPFEDEGKQKAASIIVLIAGILLIFLPILEIPNSFMVGVILAILGAVYLIDLK